MTYGIIGVGAIASAIVSGLCGAGGAAARVLLSPRNAATAAGLAGRFDGVAVCGSNQAVLDGAAVVILSLRPQDARAGLAGLRFTPAHTVISAMAGVKMAELAALAAPARDIARCLPMPAVARREGLTPVLPAGSAAETLFNQLGRTIAMADETALEAISAATATIAAHFAYLQAIGDWLAAKGIAENAARHYIGTIFAGLAPELLAAATPFEHLAREHATRGGINAQFRDGLAEGGVFGAVDRELQRVFERLMK